MFRVKRFILLFVLLFFISQFSYGVSVSENGAKLAGSQLEPPKVKYEKAKIIEAEKIDINDSMESQLTERHQQVTLQILSGKLKGKKISLDHIAAGGMMGAKMNLVPGDKVILYVEEEPTKAESPDGSPLVHIDDYSRSSPLFWLTVIYGLIICGIGGKKGVKAVLSLGLTILIIFFVLFPLTLWGFNPLLVSVVISGVISLLVFRIVGGRTAKALSAAIGTLIGVAIAGILATIIGKMIHLTGLSSEESKLLLYSLNVKIDFQGLLFSGILIGALGAVMDVGMSIASAIDEVRKVHPEANFINLFNAGMNVGRDIMGTMSNTLILAYTGSALPLLLLFIAGNIPITKIINMEMVAEEIARALAGSIGLVLCIPATALVAAAMYTRHSRHKNQLHGLPEGWMKR
jgi:uncharacterized membrane protein